MQKFLYIIIPTFALSELQRGESGEGGSRTLGTLRYTTLAKLHDRPL